MRINKSRLIASLAFLSMMAVALAQSTTSPYSKIGYGLLNDNATGIQRSMGGVGYAMQNPRQINTMNPASYSQVDSLTFLWDIGLDLTNLWSKEDGAKGHNFGGGLDYIAAQFRITKGLGGSFGLIPYASVGYSFGTKWDNSSERRIGSGSINQLYLGFGWEPFKGLSIGGNVAYMFGTTSNISQVNTTSTTVYQRIVQVRDYNVQLGVQYGVDLREGKDRLVLGATYQPKKSFHGHTWGLYYDVQDIVQDTIGYTSMSGKHEQPHSIGVGVSYTYDRRWMTEVDFTYQNWHDAKYHPLEGFEVNTLKFDNRWKVAAGLQYSPNRRGSFFGAMSMRIGGHYTHDYINITGSNLRDYGVSLGVSLPVPNGKSTINLGFGWDHRYSTKVAMIEENYLNITLGITFNELWFWKSKIR